VVFLLLKKDYFFSVAAGAAGAAAGAPAAGAASAGAAAGATGAGASFLPQAAKEIANKEAINSDFFILFP
jgi:hypothetical protein